MVTKELRGVFLGQGGEQMAVEEGTFRSPDMGLQMCGDRCLWTMVDSNFEEAMLEVVRFCLSFFC